MISSTNGKRILVIIIVTMFILLAGVAMAGGECKGASCDPLPPEAQACEHATNNPHCSPTSPIVTSEPQPSPTMPPPYASPTPQLQPPPTATPGYHKATSIPFFTPTPIGEQEIPGWPDVPPPCGYTMDTLCDGVTPPPLPTHIVPTRVVPASLECGIPASDLGPDEVALLIEAVHEGWTIVIVKDVLATNNDDIVVIGND